MVAFVGFAGLLERLHVLCWLARHKNSIGVLLGVSLWICGLVGLMCRVGVLVLVYSVGSHSFVSH